MLRLFGDVYCTAAAPDPCVPSISELPAGITIFTCKTPKGVGARVSPKFAVGGGRRTASPIFSSKKEKNEPQKQTNSGLHLHFYFSSEEYKKVQISSLLGEDSMKQEAVWARGWRGMVWCWPPTTCWICSGDEFAVALGGVVLKSYLPERGGRPRDEGQPHCKM